MNQLMIVAAVAGSISRNGRLKELIGRLDKAVSTLPDRASWIGFKALTKPERIKNKATHAGPWATSRKMGLCINEEGPLSLSAGLIMERAKVRVMWLHTTKTAAMSRRPYGSG